MSAENTPDSGAPDTIVLVHGFWVTPLSWENWVERYEERGYRVLTPTYPGFAGRAGLFTQRRGGGILRCSHRRMSRKSSLEKGRFVP